MDLIYFRGLNCHTASIINIASLLGINYTDAFSTLWSETDFADEKEYNIFVSKRLLLNLKKTGLIFNTFDCKKIKADEILPQIYNGEFFLIGMDIFYIPWHQVYGHFHGPHYFFAKKETEQSIVCFDPVYNENKIKLKPNDILPFAFELSRFYKTDAKLNKNVLTQEARAVILSHPKIKEELLSKIQRSNKEERAGFNNLIKQIIAMINNRYLFRQFFHMQPLLQNIKELFFNAAYFLKWEAVKNGLYKALILKDNKSILDEVQAILDSLIQEEINMANELLNKDFKNLLYYSQLKDL